MKKSRIILIVLVAALLSALTAFAVSSANDVVMTFDKGTDDEVANMPQTETLSTEYTVPENVPEREGYEFLYWTLDYEAKTSYTVRYVLEGTDEDIAKPKVVSEAYAFTNVTEAARAFDGYDFASDLKQSVVLDPDSGKNVITFYYKKATPAMATYTVMYIDMEGNFIADWKIVDNVYEGDIITEYPKMISDYTPLDNEIIWQVTDGDIIFFEYYYSAPVYDE